MCPTASASLLPIHDILDAIRVHLAAHDRLIVEAPPGAGKTTVLPLALLREPWLGNRRILMLQPRRIAAKNAALRMAAAIGELPGGTVGYRMRLESRVGPQTCIEVITEGVLLRMLRADPTLGGIGLLIFDEFHERSLDADLGLSLALHALETFPEEATFKLLLMSATLDQSGLSAALGAHCISSAGRAYPVTVEYTQPARPGERIAQRVVQAIDDVLPRHPDSNFLVFLPGRGEISEVARLLNVPNQVSVHPLYGDLSLEQQQRAIAPCAAGQRKIVLATNIAETSLTIEGVDVVIDSGLERVARFDPNTAMSRLSTVRISQASSEQRKGRAGRLRAGICYRLWSAQQQDQLQAQQPPEILSADLASMALQLFAWGIFDPAEILWLDAPPAGAYEQATDLLRQLGAIQINTSARTRTFRVTAHGLAMAELPVHPRLAHMLLAAQAIGAEDTASLIAALLSDRDPVGRESPDLGLRLDYLQGSIPCPSAFQGWASRTRQLAKQFRQQLPKSPGGRLLGPDAAQLPAYLLASAYPDRIARARHSGGFQLANGRSAQFASPNPMSRSKWLAIAEISGSAGRRGDTIRCAATLDPVLFDSFLLAQLSEETVVDWDKNSGRFIAERRRSCGELTLHRERLAEVSEEARVSKLLALIRAENMRNLPLDDAAGEFLARARHMRALDAGWVDFDQQLLQDTLEDWLAPFLRSVHKLSDLKRLDMLGALQARLNWAQLQTLNEALPPRYTVPSGSSIRIDYGHNPPVLAVKLQEMFGCVVNPSLAGGRLPLVLHLLSPAGRPLQITQDIANFWRSAYPDVCKEMRGRYPKHPWPDDPLNTPATRHSKARKS